MKCNFRCTHAKVDSSITFFTSNACALQDCCDFFCSKFDFAIEISIMRSRNLFFSM